MTVIEKIGSRDYELTKKDANFKLEWFITGSDDEVVVFNTLQSYAPGIYAGLVLQKLNINQEAPTIWTGIAEYGTQEEEDSQEKPKIGEFTFSFETGGGKQKITNAPLASTAPTGYNSEASSAGPPLNFKGGIGVTNDSVEGVEILVPSLTFEVASKIPGGKLTMSYARTVANVTGTVNKKKFLDCDAGTLLFEGCSGSYKVGENIDRELKFKFSYSPNKVNIKIGDIVVADKRGWQYLWVHYRKSSDGGFVTMQPYKAFVHDVYEEVDFRRYLGFG